jgi:hypothetical protein
MSLPKLLTCHAMLQCNSCEMHHFFHQYYHSHHHLAKDRKRLNQTIMNACLLFIRSLSMFQPPMSYHVMLWFVWYGYIIDSWKKAESDNKLTSTLDTYLTLARQQITFGANFYRVHTHTYIHTSSSSPSILSLMVRNVM